MGHRRRGVLVRAGALSRAATQTYHSPQEVHSPAHLIMKRCEQQKWRQLRHIKFFVQRIRMQRLGSWIPKLTPTGPLDPRYEPSVEEGADTVPVGFAAVRWMGSADTVQEPLEKLAAVERPAARGDRVREKAEGVLAFSAPGAAQSGFQTLAAGEWWLVSGLSCARSGNATLGTYTNAKLHNLKRGALQDLRAAYSDGWSVA